MAEDLLLDDERREKIGRDLLAYIQRRIGKFKYEQPSDALCDKINRTIYMASCGEKTSYKKPPYKQVPIVAQLSADSSGEYVAFLVNTECECFRC